MAVFRYTGFDAGGRGVSGTLEAPTEKGALDQLSGGGVTPVELEQSDGKDEKAAARVKEKGAFGAGGAFGARIPMAARVLFVRELATFIHADIPLLDALDVLRRQESNAAFKSILDEVHDRVQGGEAFSHALAAHGRLFPPLLVNMVRVGETGGMLGKVLDQLATWMEHEEEVRGEIVGALAYPLMIVALGVVTVFVLLSYVLPKITAIFAGMEANLPLLTRALMGTAGFMGHWWWLILIGAVSVAVGVRLALRSAGGKAFYDRASLSVPIFGALTRKAAIARFARANAALLSAGVPLLESLRVVRGLLGNSLMAAMVDTAIERVTRGHSLAKTLEQSPYFPPSVIHLLGVGERTGRLGEMFERVAETFERQTRNQIKIMLNLLSPLMIIALAVVVALIAISILLPIFRLNQLMR